MFVKGVKPNDFFVGIIDFFAILLPGGLSVIILHPLIGSYVMGEVIAFSDSATGWIVFLISAYFLGHLVFLAGSFLDPIYHQCRKRLSPYTDESAYAAASVIRKSMLSKREIKATNTFQWSRSILTSLFPPAAGEVHRLEADSKFFRSLIVVLALGGLVFLLRGKELQASVAFLLLAPCAVRYYERRLKCTTLAYQYIITYYRLGKLVPPTLPLKRTTTESAAEKSPARTAKRKQKSKS